jgi:diguanylate cyclase (GGDEF)-like protein
VLRIFGHHLAEFVFLSLPVLRRAETWPGKCWETRGAPCVRAVPVCSSSGHKMSPKSIPEDPAQELNRELRNVSNRDLQLWSIGLLVLIVLAVGFLALVLPNLLWNAQPFRVNTAYLPQLFTGFIVLIFLFNIYLFDQKRRLNATQEKLIRRLMLDARPENPGVMDPLTQVFSRYYAESVIPKETSRVERHGGSLSFLLAAIADWQDVNARFGAVAADHVLLVTAQLLKKTLRGSDIICRYTSHEFLVLMPETRASQAQNAVRRLARAIQTWNQTTEFKYKLELNVGVADYRPGAELETVLDNVRQHTRSVEITEVTI